MNISVKVGPNPFNPQTPVVISVNPSINIPGLVNISAQITIYDPIGNVVFKDGPRQNPSGQTKVEFTWNGANAHGRIVGAGTYLALVTYTDLSNGNKNTTKAMVAFRK